MRRILLAATGTLAATVAVLLYPTSTNKPVATGADTVAVASPAATADPTTAAPATSDPTASATASAATSGTFAASTSMRYGTVSVTVTVADGTITDVTATQSSDDAKSQLISSQAIPTLNTEAVAAQSAAIAMVSHATYTSQAYAQSLQAAIDRAFGA